MLGRVRAGGSLDDPADRRRPKAETAARSPRYHQQHLESKGLGESEECPMRPPAKTSACLEGPIRWKPIGTLHSPAVSGTALERHYVTLPRAVSHLLSDTTFPQPGILRVPLFVPVLAGFLLRTTQVRSALDSNWQPLISPEVPGEGETIEGSRTMRNRPYPVLK